MNTLAIQSGRHCFEWQHCRYDGLLLFVEVTLTAINMNDEILLHVVWLDISERKNNEAKLRESELRWKFAIEGTGDGVWDWNIETNHAVYSTRWKEMLGYSEEDIQPTNAEWQTRIHPDDKTMVYGTMQAYLQGDLPSYRVEYRLKCKDESYKWILGRGMVVSRDQSGSPLRMIGTHTDITAAKESELMLIQLKKIAELDVIVKDLQLIKRTQELVMITQRFQTSFEYAPIGVVNMTLDGSILEVNQSFCSFIGYSHDELLAMNFEQLIHPDDQFEKLKNINSLLVKDDSIVDWEHQYTSKEGEIVWGHVLVKLIRTEDGIPDYFINIIEDITERKHQEVLLLEAKERAERLAKTKSQFLANMSHEIRTPMNAIIGFSNFTLLEKNPEEINKNVQYINAAATHLQNILNDILDLSKLEVGRLILKPEAFDLDELLHTVYYFLKNAAESKSLHLIIDKDDNAPAILIGDKLRLRQVLINLVGNAIKFTDQGSVKLIVNLNQLDELGARLLFLVEDTGIGIAIEQYDQLFQAFSQLDNGYSRSFGGTGLGLVISQDLIGLMGGEIKVESCLGGGSCFSFEILLPVVPLTNLSSG